MQRRADGRVVNGSLRDRVAARQAELEHSREHTILLPVPRFEELLAVQYRPLGYREAWRIEERHEKVKDGAEQALLVAADKLLAACERLVEATSIADEYRDTGQKWGLAAARDMFGLDLPDGTTSRQALLAIFAGDEGEECLVRHAADYEEQRRVRVAKIGRVVEGESQASSAGI